MTVGIEALGNSAEELIDRVSRGEEIVLTKNGRPVARMVPLLKKGRRQPDVDKGRMWVAEDFDELPQEVLKDFEG